MTKITLGRAGYGHSSAVETSDLMKGRFKVGDIVLLAVKGDCGMKRSSFHEYEVVGIKPCNRFGGTRETVTFRRVNEGGAK